jgi:hypothetical protein
MLDGRETEVAMSVRTPASSPSGAGRAVDAGGRPVRRDRHCRKA